VLEAARQSPQPGTRVFALGFVIMAGLGARLPQQIAPLIAEFQVVVDKMGLAIFKTIGDGFDACRRVLSGEHSGTAAMLGVIDDAATHLVFYRPFSCCIWRCPYANKATTTKRWQHSTWVKPACARMAA